jgi:predicted DNA-binding transcriptional regulator AlpA
MPEIAARLSVARATVDSWRKRYDSFPSVRWTVGGGPAWNWHEVERWARETGRNNLSLED